MIEIDHNGIINKWFDEEEETKELDVEEVSEKELLLSIAAKLDSIRGMLIFFITMTTIGIIGSYNSSPKDLFKIIFLKII